MKMIEAAYFIFFLPLSAIENSEVSQLIILTVYTSVFSIINLFYFTFFNLVKSKSEKWKYDIKLKGYWVEVTDAKIEYSESH